MGLAPDRLKVPDKACGAVKRQGVGRGQAVHGAITSVPALGIWGSATEWRQHQGGAGMRPGGTVGPRPSPAHLAPHPAVLGSWDTWGWGLCFQAHWAVPAGAPGRTTGAISAVLGGRRGQWAFPGSRGKVATDPPRCGGLRAWPRVLTEGLCRKTRHLPAGAVWGRGQGRAAPEPSWFSEP